MGVKIGFYFMRTVQQDNVGVMPPPQLQVTADGI